MKCTEDGDEPPPSPPPPKKNKKQKTKQKKQQVEKEEGTWTPTEVVVPPAGFLGYTMQKDSFEDSCKSLISEIDILNKDYYYSYYY